MPAGMPALARDTNTISLPLVSIILSARHATADATVPAYCFSELWYICIYSSVGTYSAGSISL